jgi:hypothetical protein
MGYMVYMKKSMIYLTKLADDNLTPVQWNNKRKLALIIPSLKQAYAVAQRMQSKAGNCMIMSVDSLGIVRKCSMPAETLEKFDTTMTFSSGGSVTTQTKARSTDHAIIKAFRDMKTLNCAKDTNRIVSMRLVPKSE